MILNSRAQKNRKRSDIKSVQISLFLPHHEVQGPDDRAARGEEVLLDSGDYGENGQDVCLETDCRQDVLHPDRPECPEGLQPEASTVRMEAVAQKQSSRANEFNLSGENSS